MNSVDIALYVQWASLSRQTKEEQRKEKRKQRGYRLHTLFLLVWFLSHVISEVTL